MVLVPAFAGMGGNAGAGTGLLEERANKCKHKSCQPHTRVYSRGPEMRTKVCPLGLISINGHEKHTDMILADQGDCP
jgi:hypothetical protein